MIKGLIEYNQGQIPFVIENFQLILFSEKELVSEFTKEHNRKSNYILVGKCFAFGNQPSNITLLVERSIGEICYLKCYIVNGFGTEKKINLIRFESRVLDSIFRYKYHYIDLAREGVNLTFSRGNRNIQYTF